MKLNYEYIKEKNIILANKPIGMTPLGVIEYIRSTDVGLSDMKMGYAGRLDPMASGLIIILIGDECKRRDRYQELDKLYEFSLILGISTDSYDALGLITYLHEKKIVLESFDEELGSYIGGIEIEYPPYSSYAIDGVPLYRLAKEGNLPKKLPSNKVEIYSLKLLSVNETSIARFASKSIEDIRKVGGDFRQDLIIRSWESYASEDVDHILLECKMSAHVSSGTYIRSLCNQIGRDMGVGAIATNIHRLRVGDFFLTN